MPNVNGRNYSYDAKGKAAAAKARSSMKGKKKRGGCGKMMNKGKKR
tara:strand:- start:278 stop:415 length:138 start_codon:yes stop_codon:yes gene_type:complete